MAKAELCRVKINPGRRRSSVKRVAQNGEAMRGGMDADLMGASGGGFGLPGETVLQSARQGRRRLEQGESRLRRIPRGPGGPADVFFSSARQP